MQYNKTRLFSLSALLIYVVPASAIAHPGGLDGNGGHRCIKNCEQYELRQGQYHRHKPGTFEVLPEPVLQPARQPVMDTKKQQPDKPFFTWTKILWAATVSLIISTILDLLCFINKGITCLSNWLCDKIASLLRRQKRNPNKK